jgi:hypothetical protein
VTLAQHREHALAKFRQVRQRALAPKQLATEFGFQGLDGSAQSRLRYVAPLGRFGQIQRFAERQKVTDMVHFQGMALATHSRINADLFGCLEFGQSDMSNVEKVYCTFDNNCARCHARCHARLW